MGATISKELAPFQNLKCEMSAEMHRLSSSTLRTEVPAPKSKVLYTDANCALL